MDSIEPSHVEFKAVLNAVKVDTERMTPTSGEKGNVVCSGKFDLIFSTEKLVQMQNTCTRQY